MTTDPKNPDILPEDDPSITLQNWLRYMHEHKASDLFLTAGFPPAVKLDGKITRISD